MHACLSLKSFVTLCSYFLLALPSHTITFMYRVMVEAGVEVVQVGVEPATAGVVLAEILTVLILVGLVPVEVVLAEVYLRQYL